MSVGYFPASRFPLLGAVMVLLGLVICQLIAYYFGHQELFPHSSIYHCARHAPEFVWFRITTICGATLFLLSWLINFAFFIQVSPSTSIFAGLVTLAGIGSSLAQMLAAATIDTGKEKAKWVEQSRELFALLTVIVIVGNTALNWYARKVNRGVKKSGVQIKLALTGILLFLTYQAYVLPTGDRPERNMVEYGWVATVLAYYVSMSRNYKKYILDYELTA